MGGLGMAGLGLLLVLLGADSLLRGVAGLLQRFGVGAERTGALLVLVAAWIPQLAITLQALRAGDPSLALAGAVGAGVGNLGLLLGLSALVAPLAAGLQLLPALRIFALVAAGLVLALARDGVLQPWEGGVLVAAFVAVLAFAMTRVAAEPAAVREDFAKVAITRHGLLQNLVRIAFAGALVYFGSDYLARNASAAGIALGFGGAAAAMVVLGIGASLPAIGITALAAINGLGRAVLAQALLAALANLLFGVGLVALHGAAPVDATVLLFGLPAAMAFALLLIPLSRAGLGRREGSWLVLAFVAWAIALALA